MSFRRLRLVLFCLLLLCGLSGAAEAAGTFINKAQPASGQCSFVTTCATAAQTHTGGSGYFLSVFVMWQSSTFTSVTDTAGNTFTQCGTEQAPSGTNKYRWYYARDITGNASNQVTLTVGASSNLLTVSVLHYSGMMSTSPCDVTDTGSGTGTSADTGAFTTATSDEVIHAHVLFSSAIATESAGTGYTLGHNALYSGFLSDEYDTDATNTAGSNTATMTWTGVVNWFIGAVAYKSADGGGGATAAPRSLNTTGVGR